MQLENAPLKYEGLSYTEIWISESQERMVLVGAAGEVAGTSHDSAKAKMSKPQCLAPSKRSGRLKLSLSGKRVADPRHALFARRPTNSCEKRAECGSSANSDRQGWWVHPGDWRRRFALDALLSILGALFCLFEGVGDPSVRSTRSKVVARSSRSWASPTMALRMPRS